METKIIQIIEILLLQINPMQIIDITFIVAIVTATWNLATMNSKIKENKQTIKSLGRVLLQIANKLNIEVVGIDDKDFK